MPGILTGIRELHSNYKNRVDDPISKEELKTLLSLYNDVVGEKLLDGSTVVLPNGLGKLVIEGNKPKVKVEQGKVKGLSIDHKKTKELWADCEECKERKQLVYHENLHSDGYIYRIKWKKKNVYGIYKFFYEFFPNRKLKRSLAKNILNGSTYLKSD